jgi:hypothetical protein
MPSLLEPPWRQLIPLIPVADHTEVVNAARWQRFLQKNGLAHYHQAIFREQAFVPLPRSRLLDFAYPTAQQKCLEILLWGYPAPNAFRANLVPFLQNLDRIAKAAADHVEWPQYYRQLHEIGHLGIAMITKLAYFHRLTFQKHQALILDRKIIAVAGRWQPLHIAQLTYGNAPGEYVNYLEQMAHVSARIGATPDQVEFFLFSWGKAF